MLNEQQAQHLVQTYSDKILRLSYSYLKHTQDAEDICQTVFLKYLTLQPEFESDEHEKAWILRTTVNACKDHLRSAFFRRTAPLEDAALVAVPAALRIRKIGSILPSMIFPMPFWISARWNP